MYGSVGREVAPPSPEATAEHHSRDDVSEISNYDNSSAHDAVSSLGARNQHGTTRDRLSNITSSSNDDPIRHSKTALKSRGKLSSDGSGWGYGVSRSPMEPRQASHWSVGWKTMSITVTSYLSALLLAIGHFLLFRHLDGQPTSSLSVLSQSHVTAVSTLFVVLFRACLVASLGVAFTQQLWQLFRRRPMRVATIESLYQLRSNALSSLHLGVIREAPVLVLLAIVIWSITIATIFPPGAITVGTTSINSSRAMSVSIFDPTNGNDTSTAFDRTVADIGENLDDGNVGGTEMMGMMYRGPKASLYNLAQYLASTGEIPSIPPPSGSNSSYSFSFEGPSFNCNQSVYNKTSLPYDTVADGGYSRSTVYDAHWNSPYEEYKRPDYENPPFKNSTYTNTYIVRKARIIGAFSNFSRVSGNKSEQELEDALWKGSAYHGYIARTVKEWAELICTPYITQYHANLTYINGEQRMQWTALPIQPMNFTKTQSKGTFSGVKSEYNEWKTGADLADFYRDINIQAVIESIIQPLQGTSYVYITASVLPLLGRYTLPGNRIVELANVSSPPGQLIHHTGDIDSIEKTIFNTERLSNTYDTDPRTDFDISEAKLNDALANLSIAAIKLGTWYRDLPIHTVDSVNAYYFSHPLNLLLPYFLSLAFALPFVILGILALYSNGVPAIDGGFVQIAMTTTNDGSLCKAAAVGCLGGEENVPTELKDLKVKYGEFVGGEKEIGSSTARAGFGTEDEIRPLRRGGGYSDV